VADHPPPSPTLEFPDLGEVAALERQAVCKPLTVVSGAGLVLRELALGIRGD
jgi:hypothetical protein